MAINASIKYNGGLLHDIILLTNCYYRYHWGTRLNPIKSFFFVFAAYDPTYRKHFDISPPCLGDAQKV